MQLKAGDRLGGYEVTGALGAGGMGEVFRARDTKLGRDVALKVLPASFAGDPERIARFRREAQVLATLNHRHIGAIHGVEDWNGAQVLVLEFVDGSTLADRLRRGPLPIDEAIAVARQIAEALGAAHEKGIVHRDLKPANIALSSQDQVKVLDFGLARAVDAIDGSDTSNSPTLTLRATQAGVILGTAAYMSPEQAKGRVADKRADVWGFGCVLYEMLAGRRAFEGEDVSDMLAAVLRGDPDWSALPPATPPAVRMLIQQCLAKDRKERVADIAVAAYVLRTPAIAAPVTAAPIASRRFPIAAFAAAMAAAAAIAGAAGWSLRRAEAPVRPLVRFAVNVPNDQIISDVARRRHLIALSPDGTQLAYTANDQIYIRSLNALDAVPVRGSHEQPFDVTFSPDGQWLAYTTGGKLKKLSVTGGVSVTIADVPQTFGISWSGNRIFIGAGTRGVLEVPAEGGLPKTVVEPPGGSLGAHGPQLLPDAKTLLLTIGDVTQPWSTAEIAAVPVAGGQRATLVRGGTDARYLSTGHLVFVRDGVLFANAFDVDRLTLKGGPVGIVDSVALSAGPTGAAHFAVSASGLLAHLPAVQGSTSSIAWRTRQGTETAVPAPVHAYDMPRLSPDGRRIALHAIDQNNDIWVWDTVSATLTRLTFEPGTDSFPVWTVDGKRIIYASIRGNDPNLYWRPSDGTGQAEPLLRKPPDGGGALVPNAVTPDGRTLVYSVGTPSNIMTLALDGSSDPKPLLTNPQYAERGANVSPDGRFIAYQSDESGAFQVYVRPFPNVDDGRWQLSGEGGIHPLWSPRGHELFYLDSNSRIIGVPVETGASFSFGRPANVFDFSDRPSSVYRNFDVAADGSRFVVVKEPARARTATQIIVTLDWFDELKRRVPGR